jgi:site-specific DNA-methyltransferase (adenine-specific)
MAMSIRFAGFEIRDMIAWVYGSGFPKSLDVSKAIDKAAGAEREVVGSYKATGTARNSKHIGAKTHAAIGEYERDVDCIFQTAPATEAAKQWEGWGTALKPSLEPITLARKPLIGTVAANVLEHGTGGLNIDGCRIEANGDKLGGGRISTTTDGWDRPWKHDSEAVEACKARGDEAVAKAEQLGRFPANFIHNNSEEVLALLGEAARFYYSPKASRDDRDEGCGALPLQVHQSGMGGAMPIDDDGNDRDRFKAISRNPHPTVKPTDLMRYLCRLITPPNGIVLDPFTGSGSTGKAAMAEGFRFIGIEREAEYIEIARARISAEAEKPRQLSLF